MKPFKQKLYECMDRNNSLVSVGLDPTIEKIPSSVKVVKNPFFAFNKAIIDATHDLVCVFKLNAAFYEAEGADGVLQMKMTFDYIRETYPRVPTILDAKRIDISNTNHAYKKYFFEYLNADSVTIYSHVGLPSAKIFLDEKDRGVIVLVRTSNAGAEEMQDVKVDGKPYYQYIVRRIVDEWNYNDNCMMVAGATYPEEIKEIRELAGDMTFLSPGVGAQKGALEKAVLAGLNSVKKGMIVNSSRGIIFASSGADFAERAREEAVKLRDEINKYR